LAGEELEITSGQTDELKFGALSASNMVKAQQVGKGQMRILAV